MLFRTHLVFGILVWFLLERFIEMPLFVLVFVLLGVVFVDIDSWNSKMGNHFLLRPLQWFTRHRGIFHSLIVCIFISLFVGLLSLWGGFGFLMGYLSHLGLDCFTKSGVRIFWPLGFRIKGFVKGGSWIEDVIFVLILLVDFLFGVLWIIHF